MWLSERMQAEKQYRPALAVVTGLSGGMTLSSGGEITGAPVVNTMRDPAVGDQVLVLPYERGNLYIGVVEGWDSGADLVLQRGKASIRLKPDGDVVIGGAVIHPDGRIESVT